jgi:hypothetical protein
LTNPVKAGLCRLVSVPLTDRKKRCIKKIKDINLEKLKKKLNSSGLVPGMVINPLKIQEKDSKNSWTIFS